MSRLYTINNKGGKYFTGYRKTEICVNSPYEIRIEGTHNMTEAITTQYNTREINSIECIACLSGIETGNITHLLLE